MTKKLKHAKQFGQPGAPKPAANNQVRYRDEIVQILISQLNEVDKETSKEKKYLLVESLIAMGIGLEVRRNGKVIKYEPSLQAIKEVLDRLIGKAPQSIGFDGGENGGKVTIVFDVPGDEEL